jgi:hypothetical protein
MPVVNWVLAGKPVEEVKAMAKKAPLEYLQRPLQETKKMLVDQTQTQTSNLK